MRIIGDTHGLYHQYQKIAHGAEDSIQIGDMGFSYGFFKHYNLDPTHHRFFGGNHDNYDAISSCPNNLGDFGLITTPIPFFFVRGAWSIDKAYRTEGKDWWAAEELTLQQGMEALEAYKAAKPSLMLTHDCPDEVGDWFLENGLGLSKVKIKTRTAQLLQAMLETHSPQRWFFGHWHKSVKLELRGCQFQCLRELEWIDV